MLDGTDIYHDWRFLLLSLIVTILATAVAAIRENDLPSGLQSNPIGVLFLTWGACMLAPVLALLMAIGIMR